jgi:hypothetical protein
MKKLFIFLAVLLFASSSFAQTNNVLFEGCTGTWCQWCPCGHTIVDGFLTNRPNTLVLEYHGGSSSDPWVNFNGNTIISLIGFSSYPTGVIGRRSGIVDRSSWSGQVYSQGVNFPSPITLGFNKTYNSGTRALTVNVSSLSLRQIDTNTYINFVIYENNLIYTQTGNSSCTGGTNYVHKFVVRDMVNGATGQTYSSGTWAAGVLKNATFNYTLPTTWVDSNCYIGLFVYFYQGSISSLTSYVLQTAKGRVAGTNLSGVNINSNEFAQDYYLAQNYPNPFNPNTNIKFSIPKEGQVTLKVYDMVGNEVATYFDTYLKNGIYNVEFDGSKLSSGIYFYKLTAGSFSETKKMILIK